MHSENEASASVHSLPNPGFETAISLDGKPMVEEGGVKACHNCGISLVDDGAIYSIGDKLTCDYCAAKIRPPAAQKSADMGSGLRGAAYGALAALGSAVVYALVAISTGFEIGFMALAVGYAVGWSVKRG